ncbi:methyltransferase domain-containing protein [Sneathiella sp. CAU 1612]|uniref:Methyltransferase domain-containing protein n=1 Tax=Sneathiella sedimenti TaxID=2816034 RepID=A0ABS3F1D6_9PROT|nr:methyltransferase domain-containing protein [Sneathiella sedimenti]MBO0332330.1 methyltransferase domain-containing protein [Sneathiella sedimenti]
MAWNPEQYTLFSDHRLRPAMDLLSQVPLNSPSVIYDLGCGTGNVTALLSQHWNEAIITGIDSSKEMLAKARKDHPSIEWKLDDISQFSPTSKGNLLFSNAALHWLDDHETLFPTLLKQLRAGGVLAVQMPNNFSAPSHQNLYDLALSPEWVDRLGPLVRPAPVHNIDWYFDLLSPLVEKINIWETTYFQILKGKDAVLEWTRGTALRPFLAALDETESKLFESQYAEMLMESYPVGQDDATLYPFSRLFIVVQTPEE